MRRVAIVTFEGGQSLDVTGPLEVFSVATRILEASGSRRAGYRVTVASPAGGTVRMASGLQLVADCALGRLRPPLDTLLVAGGEGTRQAFADPRMKRGLRRLAPSVRRLGSVCTGAFCLAEAGLLEDKRVTTHWGACELLAQRYPSLRVEADAIFVRHGKVWTSAGVTAGMDLALAMVEEDLGHELALRVARQLVMFMQRPGGQSQFSETLRAQAADSDALRGLSGYIADNLEADLSVPALSRRCGMSQRSFARAFARELGETPARHVERVRVEAARRLLQSPGRALDAVAGECGFGSVETMRRAFHRQLKISPRQYRAHFAEAG